MAMTKYPDNLSTNNIIKAITLPSKKLSLDSHAVQKNLSKINIIRAIVLSSRELSLDSRAVQKIFLKST